MFKLRIPIVRGSRPADVTPFVAARLAVQIPSPVQAATDCDNYLLTIFNPSYIFRLLAKYRNTAMNEVFQALSDPTRREILRLLRSGDMTAGDIAERFSLSRSTLSGHFSVLKHAGLIVAKKNGTSLVYSLNVSAVEQALAAVLNLLDVGKRSNKRSKT
jgi:ArsR family transcriptional regulator, arsenate/arsenite/antimonite-responsive transcriptional repressor